MPDDHGPRAGCNFQQCGKPEDASNCPFVSDSSMAYDEHWPPPPHIHEFTIPVQWKNLWDSRRPEKYEVPDGRKVTRIMCRCGTEMER